MAEIRTADTWGRQGVEKMDASVASQAMLTRHSCLTMAAEELNLNLNLNQACKLVRMVKVMT